MYKLISVNNPNSVGMDFIGEIGNFQFTGIQFFFLDLYSSRVKTIALNDDNSLTVTTKNTEYIFEKANLNKEPK